ncbi:MAG: tryptophan synthase subunit alpha, partial [Deltaproteobacteria bacterium]
MNRIDRQFLHLRKNNKKAFIAFITCGYPNLKVTEMLVKELARNSVDIIELGVPFSDPMADGPLIQEASQSALKKNVNLPDILRMVKRLRKQVDIPLCLMTYYNPIFCFGPEKFAKAASACGVDGVIVPDLTLEEAKPFIRAMSGFGLEVILFIAPTTALKRIRVISRMAKGFIYYVSLTGVTGPRQNLPHDLAAKLRQIKKITRKPVCVGFGVAGKEQVRQVYKISDGVIVGSAIIRKIKE